MKKPVLALAAASAFFAFALAACSPGADTSSTNPPAPTGGQPVAVDFNATIAPVIKKNCVSCHSGDTPAGRKAFPADITESWAKENGRLMKQAAKEVAGDKMPPKDATQRPTADEAKAFVDWVSANIS
jgi:cytochrome c5